MQEKRAARAAEKQKILEQEYRDEMRLKNDLERAAQEINDDRTKY